MTPHEIAKELYQKYSFRSDINPDEIKQCALIAVDEIMTALTVIPYGMQYLSAINYWEGVKKEIEKL